MSEKEKQEKQAEPESYTSGGVTYVGAVRARYGRLQEAVDELRQQAGWLVGYLFVVGEHFADAREGSIPEQTAAAYLDAVPGVATDVRAALEEVERHAAELRRAMAAAPPAAGPSPT